LVGYQTNTNTSLYNATLQGTVNSTYGGSLIGYAGNSFVAIQNVTTVQSQYSSSGYQGIIAYVEFSSVYVTQLFSADQLISQRHTASNNSTIVKHSIAAGSVIGFAQNCNISMDTVVFRGLINESLLEGGITG
jgi:hypothetical protein